MIYFFFQVHVFLVDVYHNSDFYSLYLLYIIFGVLYSVTVFANMLEIFLSISPDNRRSPFNRIFLNFLIFSSNRVILHVLFPHLNSYPCRSRLLWSIDSLTRSSSRLFFEYTGASGTRAVICWQKKERSSWDGVSNLRPIQINTAWRVFILKTTVPWPDHDLKCLTL